MTQNNLPKLLSDFGADELVGHVRVTRKRWLKHTAIKGACWSMAAALGWLMTAALLDILTPLPVPMRVALCVGLWLTLAVVATITLAPLLRPPSMERTAFSIENTIPGMHNRLVSVLDLKERNPKQGEWSESFVRRLVEQARQKMQGYRPDQVVSQVPLRKSIIGVAAAVVIAAGLMLGMREQMPTAAQRILQPTAAIAPASWVRLAAEPGDESVLLGEPVTILGLVQRGNVDSMTLRMRATGTGASADFDGDGQWTRYDMQRDAEGRWHFNISALTSTQQYQLFAGKTWTPVHTLTIVRRPVIERVQAAVHLPTYMRMPEPQPVEDDAVQISAPVGSQVELAAQVQGEIAAGQVQLFDVSETTQTQTQERTTVWFEDDVPADAELIGRWRWVESQAYSGVRAHTFPFTDRSYGFRTRLNRLSILPGASLVFHVLLDKTAPPRQLIVTVERDGKERKLLWDSPAHPATDAQRKQMAYIGNLPKAGEWVRLEVAGEQLAGSKPKKEMKLGGMSFEIDQGRAYFDRPGALHRSEEQVTTAEFTPAERIDMSRDERGRWVARVPVERDVHWSVSFTNTLGHTSQAMKPMGIVATEDQPPVVHVERPGRHLTLPEAEAVPVMVRAFDDYGVGSIGVEIGTSADALGEPRWLSDYDQPQRNRLLMTAVDPAAHQLEPGQALHYRLVVRDSHDQLAHSEIYRLAIAADDAMTPEVRQHSRADLGGLLGGIANILDAQGRIITRSVELLADLPEELIGRSDDGTLVLTHEDGTPLTAQELGELYEQSLQQLSEEERAAFMQDLNQHLAEQRELAQQAQRDLDAAAAAAQQSAVAMPAQAEALRDMARQLQRLTEADDAEGDDALRRLAQLQELLPEQQAELNKLQQQLQQMQQAQQQVASDPSESQQQMATLLAQRQAQQQMRQLQQYDQRLGTQQQQLEQLRVQLEQLQAQAAAQQRAAELDAVSDEQAQLDEQLLAEFDRTQQMIRQQPDNDEMQPPPAPWTPPGERVQRMPVERDTPEEAATDQAAADPADADAKAAATADAEAEEDNWWDQPVESPQVGQTAEMDERFAERDQRAVPEAEAQPEQPGEAAANPTPRQMLQQHQEQMQQQLTENSRDLTQARQSAQSLSQQLQQLSEQIAQQAAAQARQQAAQQAGQEASQQPGQQPGQQAGANGEGEQPLQQMRQMMSSAEMRATQAAAQRAMMLPGADAAASQASAADPATSPPGEGRSSADAQIGEVMSMDLGGLELSARQRAAVYRLPPRLREPLLQGMAERGPDGYQTLIDAYYRQLSREAE